MAHSLSVLREPTMDEILASIREIIQENTAQAENAAKAQVNPIAPSPNQAINVAQSNTNHQTQNHQRFQNGSLPQNSSISENVAPTHNDTSYHNVTISSHNANASQNETALSHAPTPVPNINNFKAEQIADPTHSCDSLKDLQPLPSLPEYKSVQRTTNQVLNNATPSQQEAPNALNQQNDLAAQNMQMEQIAQNLQNAQIAQDAQMAQAQQMAHNAPQNLAKAMHELQPNAHGQQALGNTLAATHKNIAQNSVKEQMATEEENLQRQKIEELQQMHTENFVKYQQEIIAQHAQLLDPPPTASPADTVDDAMQALAARIGLGLEQEQTAPTYDENSAVQSFNSEEIEAAALQMQQINELYKSNEEQAVLDENVQNISPEQVAAMAGMSTENSFKANVEPTSDAMQADKQQPPLLAGFEAVAENALRPLISKWLEDQLPHLFKKILREEMARAFTKQLASLNLTDKME